MSVYNATKTQNINTNTSYHHHAQWCWGDYRTWAPCSHWIDQELVCIPTYSRVKREAICLTAEAWRTLSYAAEQWPKAQQQICERQSRPAEMLWQDSTACPQTSMNWSNAVKKSGPKFLLNERLIKSYSKLLLQVYAADLLNHGVDLVFQTLLLAFWVSVF